MFKKMSKGDIIFTVINTFVMTFMIVVCLYPILYVLFASFSDSNLLISYRGILLRPLGFNLGAYKKVIENQNIIIGYRNTLFYVALHTALALVLTIIGAFVLSRRKFMIKNIMMAMIAFTMIFGGGLIPTFIMMKSIGMYDNIFAIIIPGSISAYNLIVMRTSFAAIPVSLEESVKIDGGNDLHVLWNIVIPLSKAIIAVMILFYGVGMWNSWFNASIYLRNRNLYPLQLFLREILIGNSTDSMMTDSGSSSASDREAIAESIKYATIIVSTVPVLIIYPFLQKYFVSGIMIGAIKG